MPCESLAKALELTGQESLEDRPLVVVGNVSVYRIMFRIYENDTPHACGVALVNPAGTSGVRIRQAKELYHLASTLSAEATLWMK